MNNIIPATQLPDEELYELPAQIERSRTGARNPIGKQMSNIVDLTEETDDEECSATGGMTDQSTPNFSKMRKRLKENTVNVRSATANGSAIASYFVPLAITKEVLKPMQLMEQVFKNTLDQAFEERLFDCEEFYFLEGKTYIAPRVREWVVNYKLISNRYKFSDEEREQFVGIIGNVFGRVYAMDVIDDLIEQLL
jgi:hypothetical protein